MTINAIGGGIGGLATAVALQRWGINAHVYESAAELVLMLFLAGPRHITAEVFDQQGRRVAVFHDNPLGAGRHLLVVDVSTLPGGVYVVWVQSATASMHRLVVVLGR